MWFCFFIVNHREFRFAGFYKWWVCCIFAIMKRKYISILALLTTGLVANAALTVDCSLRKALSVTPPAGTGLNDIYIIYGGSETVLTYTSESGENNVKWLVYDERGGGYAEEVSTIDRSGAVSTFRNPRVNCGYIIEDGAKRSYFWLVDYSNYEFAINGVSFPAEQDCGSATLEVDCNCPTITYYSVTGVPKVLSREITVSYNTLEWNDDDAVYNGKETTETVANLSERMVLPAPLCDTQFVIDGDKFLSQWGLAKTFTTDILRASSIDFQTTATQQRRENGNEQGTSEDALGGSAPATITFSAICTDAVEHKEWQISKSQDFSTVDYRFNEETIDYTFDEQGSYYVKFIGSNSDASCTNESDVYTVSIGESLLDCPNAFSPDASPGYNDEWKVSYKSIVEFKCWIFDRYGNKMIEFDDPSKGWDGKYKGKYVKPGVYYYVIEAKGADGKEYKKKGDINILRSTRTDRNETTE